MRPGAPRASVGRAAGARRGRFLAGSGGAGRSGMGGWRRPAWAARYHFALLTAVPCPAYAILIAGRPGRRRAPSGAGEGRPPAGGPSPALLGLGAAPCQGDGALRLARLSPEPVLPRIRVVWLEKTFKVVESSRTCAPLTQVPKHLVHPSSKPSRDGDSTTSLGSPFQCLRTLSAKKLSLLPNLTLPWCRLRPSPLVLRSFPPRWRSGLSRRGSLRRDPRLSTGNSVPPVACGSLAGDFPRVAFARCRR